MSEICKFELKRPNNSSTLCGAYSQSETPDRKIWAHYPECTESYCPLEHPELLDGAILKTDHTMSYEEAIRRIKEHMKTHDLAEFPASAYARLNEALNMAIKALEEKIKDSWDSPPMGGFHDD